MILDWSQKYHANNMYQVVPIKIYVKNNKQPNNNNNNKNTNNQPAKTLFTINNRPYLHLCLYPYW